MFKACTHPLRPLSPQAQMRLRACCALQAQAEGQKYQIEALTAQLEHLMASKSQLESRCQLLEKVVKMREAPAPSSPQVRSPLCAFAIPP